MDRLEIATRLLAAMMSNSSANDPYPSLHDADFAPKDDPRSSGWIKEPGGYWRWVPSSSNGGVFALVTTNEFRMAREAFRYADELIRFGKENP